ncbi:hypothetical protein Barb7_01420 [Bacteroidales bacterium Barb7]|nr:hypothetical protein Barb7_01420 [Bacteroidales bacterium Barb7]
MKEEVDTTPIDYETDGLFTKTLLDYTFILATTPKLSCQFNGLISFIVQSWGALGEDINYSIAEFDKSIDSQNTLHKVIQERLDDFPLNDVGKKRIIQFYALGCLWKILFNNDYVTTSVSEEFCAILQIMLTEISLSETDFHLMKCTIEIELELSENLLPPKALASNTKYRWKAFLQHFNSPDPKKIESNAANVTVILSLILNEISLLANEEFQKGFMGLFERHELSRKTLTVNSYQRIYRNIIPKNVFDNIKRQDFFPVECVLKFPTENKFMQWKNSISSKYNIESSLHHIYNRFKHSHKCIHITLERLKHDSEFCKYINELRNQGYLDWQIVFAITNFMCCYKAQLEVSKMTFETEEQHIEALKKAMFKYHQMDESDFPIIFPIEAFKSKDFQYQIE